MRDVTFFYTQQKKLQKSQAVQEMRKKLIDTKAKKLQTLQEMRQNLNQQNLKQPQRNKIKLSKIKTQRKGIYLFADWIT